MATRLAEEIDGEGVAWAIAGFMASLVIGAVVEPLRDTVGLENVALGYLLVWWSPRPLVAGPPGSSRRSRPPCPTTSS